jgi:hypothetical protein
MLASVLAGASAGVLGGSIVARLAAAGLAVATCAAGWMVVGRGQARWFPLVVLLADAALGVAAFFMVRGSPPFPLRTLHVAALLSYGAILVATALVLLRVLNGPRALLVSFPLAIAVFVADASLTPVAVANPTARGSRLVAGFDHFEEPPRRGTAPRRHPAILEGEQRSFEHEARGERVRVTRIPRDDRSASPGLAPGQAGEAVFHDTLRSV